MTVTAASLIVFAPELASVDEAIVTAAVDAAYRRTNVAAWAGKVDDGVNNLAAHMLTLGVRIAASGAQARGALTSQTVGPLSRSFAAPPVTMSDAWLASTTYGQAYAELKATVFACREL